MVQNFLKDYLKKAQRMWSQFTPRTHLVLILAAVLVVSLGVGLGVTFSSLRNAQLNAIYAQSSQVDEVIVDIDEVLTVGLTESSPEQIAAAQKELTVAQRQIDDAIKSAEKLKKKASEKEKAHLELVQNSLGVRAYILSVAPELLGANKQAAQSLVYAAQGWKYLQNGVRKSEQAQKVQAGGDNAQLNESITLHAQARDDFSLAQANIQKAQAALPEVNLSSYLDYIVHCEEMSKAAQDADRALLKNDKKQAKKFIKKYNKLSEEAAILAHENLKPLNSAIMATYKEKTEALSNQYFSAREKVSSIDRQIR